MTTRNVRRLLPAAIAAAAGCLCLGVLTVPAQADGPQPAADRVLRVYNNNTENLVTNNANGTCTRVSATEHFRSILVDNNGRPGSGAAAPDLLILQQLRGIGQAQAYADQLSTGLGLAKGTYRAIVAWDDPETWGATHGCSQQSLGDLKKKQTNALIYNTTRLRLSSTSKYWSAGWLKPGTAYNNAKGCVLYKPPNADTGGSAAKWKRTSAIAARFTFVPTGTSVFAATMHLPQENGKNACGGAGTAGVGGTGIQLGGTAEDLRKASTVRIIGVDANRSGIAAGALSSTYGVSGRGSAATFETRKIDYLFTNGTVAPSPVNYTVAGTRSNHKALYAFLQL